MSKRKEKKERNQGMGFHHFLRNGAGFHTAKKYSRKEKHKKGY